MIRNFIAIFTCICFFSNCIPPEKQIITSINLDIKDNNLQRIYNFQNEQELDSLYAFFEHKNPTYRYAAAVAFGSIQNTEAIEQLSVLLKDKVEKVRIAAAFAIGQMADERGAEILVEAFEKNDSTTLFPAFNAAILEAVGKCAPEKYLYALSTTSTYRPQDTLLLEGQVRGIYRFALRGMTLQEGTELMTKYTADPIYPSSVRFLAAHYLQRAKNIQITTMIPELIKSYQTETEPNTKMVLAIVLGKTKNEAALQELITQFAVEDDYRVKCNILRALGNFDYNKTREIAINALKDKNLHIAQSAAQYFLQHGTTADARIYWNKAKEAIKKPVRTLLYRAALKHTSLFSELAKGAINAEIRKLYYLSDDIYTKGELLMALAEFGWNYRYIKQQADLSTSPILLSKATAALAHISNSPNFKQFFGTSHQRIRFELAQMYMQIIRKKDAGATAIAATALRHPLAQFKPILKDSLSALLQYQQKLKLPEEIETFIELERTIQYFQGNTIENIKPPLFNKAIDWHSLSSWTQNTKAIIQTPKGNILLQFLPTLAPATVANFITLTNRGFFNGKNFHRIVSNFVVQGGGTRGDGYGGANYTIRSEFSPAFFDDEGLVGMASAGLHTENTQFFITHSPTPHLDGKYTIFARVVVGMNVVHDLEVGDKISKIVIQ